MSFREAKAIEVVRWIYTERNIETSTRYTAERKNVRKRLADPTTHHSSVDDRIDYTSGRIDPIDKSLPMDTACFYVPDPLASPDKQVSTNTPTVIQTPHMAQVAHQHAPVL